MVSGDFYKENPEDRVWWKETPGVVGEFVFSFDRKTTINLFQDYPWKLTKEQREIFDRENPFWRHFFRYRE